MIAPKKNIVLKIILVAKIGKCLYFIITIHMVVKWRIVHASKVHAYNLNLIGEKYVSYKRYP